MRHKKDSVKENSSKQQIEESIANAEERRKKAVEEINPDSLTEEELDNLSNGGIGHTGGMMMR